jgi:hypothetical protein
MTTWQADVFVNSRVGRIKTQVDASTYQGATEQIYAKHGDVQSIRNLHQVRGSSSSSGDIGSITALFFLIGICVAIAYWYIVVPVAIAIGLIYWWINR